MFTKRIGPPFDLKLISVAAVILVAVLFFYALIACEAEFTSQDCDAMRCNCYRNFIYYDIQCSDNWRSLQIRISPNDFILVYGIMNIDEKAYDVLPRMSLGRIPTVNISNFMLHNYNKTLQDLLQRLGLTSDMDALNMESVDLGVQLEQHELRELKELKHLSFTNTRASHVAEDVFKDFKNLTLLELASNRIEYLPIDIFADLDNLEWLSLEDNKLANMEVGVLRILRKLKYLNLNYNQVRNLSKEVFEGAASTLTELSLINNEIDYLPADVFEQLRELRVIALSFNKFHELPQGLLAGNQKLEQFSLDINEQFSVSIPDGFFANFQYLRKVFLSCNLKQVSADMFVNSTGITYIDLSNNSLTHLPSELLQQQQSLKHLNLSHNYLEDLPNGFFNATIELATLRLSYNRLQEISNDTFALLKNLRILYLDNNRLLKIHDDAFKGIYNTNVLNLQNNHISLPLPVRNYQYYSPPFHFLSYINELNLSNNSIMYIPEPWILHRPDSSALRKFDLSYNKISSLRSYDLNAWAFYFNIRMNFSHNQISNIFIRPTEYMHSYTPVVFDLEYNPVNCDCNLLRIVYNEFTEHSKSNMFLRTNALKCEQPARLRGKFVKDLEPLELLCPLATKNETQQDECPRACTCWQRPHDGAMIVNCTMAQMAEILALPHPSKQLKLHTTELIIENNAFTHLPSANRTNGYENVTKIFAAGNNIERIELTDLPSKLVLLDVRDNRLQRLNASVLNYLLHNSSHISSVYLSKNPWICDCQAKLLLELTKVHYKSIPDIDEMRCANAQNASIIKFRDLSITDVCPPDKTFIIIVISLAFTGFIIGLISAIYYKYQQEIKVWLYAHNACLWCVSEAELDKDKTYDAFISYSHKDEEFVIDHLVPELEDKGPIQFKLCVYVRDFLIGGYIPELIANSVSDSRRTVIVLSKNFLESVWGRMEFRLAHQTALKDGRARVIIILYGEIGDIDELDSELKAYLKMNTYLKWGDPWFWQKLRYALPHTRHSELWFMRRIYRQQQQMAKSSVHFKNTSSSDGMQNGEVTIDTRKE